MMAILLFYQIFTDDAYRPYFQRSDLLSKTGLVKLKKIFSQETENPLNNNEYLHVANNYLYHQKNLKKSQLKNLNGLKLFQIEASPDKDKVAIVFQDKRFNWFLEIFSLIDDKSLDIQSFSQVNKLQIIQWGEDNTQLFLSTKTDDWRVDKYDAVKKVTDIYQGIKYDKEQLTYSTSPIKNYIIVPQCIDTCSLLIISVHDNKSSIIELEEDYISKDIEFKFFEEKHNRIGYISLDRNYYFIVDNNGYAWHKIALSDKRKTEFIGFQTTNRMLNLLAYSQSRSEIYIYDLLYYGLSIFNLNDGIMPAQQVNKFIDYIVISDNQNNAFLLNLKNLNKEKIEGDFDFITFL